MGCGCSSKWENTIEECKYTLKHTPYSLSHDLNGKTHFRKCGPINVLIEEKDHVIVGWTLVI
jgi:hypothetical protein